MGFHIAEVVCSLEDINDNLFKSEILKIETSTGTPKLYISAFQNHSFNDIYVMSAIKINVLYIRMNISCYYFIMYCLVNNIFRKGQVPISLNASKKRDVFRPKF